MISLQFGRVWAITLRYLHQSVRDLLAIADFICWPLIDIVIWGLMSVWVERSGHAVPHVVIMVVSGLVLWQIVYQANMDITNNLLDEFWSHNLVNIFSSPLTINEWISAVMLLGALKMIFIVLFGTITAWLLYAFNVFALGWALIPFALSLLLTGWCLGFFTGALIMYAGMRVHWATWIVGALISPFISIYYPVTTLPGWAQKIAYALPPPFVFEGMRKIILEHTIPFDYLGISIILNLFYLFLSIQFFKYMFEKSRNRGLARIE